ncbi:MAG: TIGR04211 family SH3 domain-containing protein [Arenicella sp.]|nr:TIGR04211 family SH3 domain-containing protein [Arenicella sp.]
MNRKRILVALAFVACLAVISQSAVAQTRYVTDDFEIMLRTGPSIQNKIVRTLRSGDRIEVLREDAGNGHSQVQTSNGEIGYLLTRFITTNRSAASRVEALNRQLEELSSEPGELRTLLANSQDENEELREENSSLSRQLKSSTAELARITEAAGNAVYLASENEKLDTEVQQLLLQLDDIRIQNETLKDQANRVDNLITAGILLLGLFLGWILSISGRRRRNSWGS